MYADGLLEMLVVCHHLREERAFNNTHHRRLFVVVGLKAGGEKVMKMAEGDGRRNSKPINLSTLRSLNQDKMKQLDTLT